MINGYPDERPLLFYQQLFFFIYLHLIYYSHGVQVGEIYVLSFVPIQHSLPMPSPTKFLRSRKKTRSFFFNVYNLKHYGDDDDDDPMPLLFEKSLCSQVAAIV